MSHRIRLLTPETDDWPLSSFALSADLDLESSVALILFVLDIAEEICTWELDAGGVEED